MDQRYFTLAEANALVPELERRFTQIMQLRAMVRIAYGALERLGEPPSAETLASPEGTPQMISARARFRGLMETLTDDLAAIETLGVAIKDLEVGLCDFLGKHDGRDVWLCWRLGEKQVRFWHELDTGFAGRQPI
jgi:hypothetical protein